MIQLPNNCRAGNFSVYPKNYKTVKANVSLIWRISYWFYDDNLKTKKKIVIKGLNHLHTLAEKREAVELFISEEKDLITRQGWNHITKTFSIEHETEITSYTSFKEALQYSFDKLKVVPETKKNVKSCLHYLNMAADKMNYSRMPIGEIRRKHLILLLEKTGEIKKGWTANTFNTYRMSLSMLYKIFVKLEILDSNIVLGIEKEKKVKKIRETLTQKQRKTVNEHLAAVDYNFWRFTQIFFHSGSRIIETLAIKKIDVDIENQRFKVTVKKGIKYEEQWRPIKNIILPLWKEVYEKAGANEYLFSKGLVPGSVKINTKQVSRRWFRRVKNKFGITADFYSLKHSNLDDIAALQGMRAAQQAAGHTTPVITMDYATGEKERQNNRLKEMKNTFS